jgi:hypothetical protein
MTGKQLLLKHRLHLSTESVEAATHVGHAGFYPDPCSCWERTHERRLLSTARTIAASRSPSRRIRTLPGGSICIEPDRATGAANGPSVLGVSCSSATRTGSNCRSRAARVPRRPDSHKARHLKLGWSSRVLHRHSRDRRALFQRLLRNQPRLRSDQWVPDGFL